MKQRKSKRKGFALLTTSVAAIAWILLAYGIFVVTSSQFNALGASKTALQAQQYATADAELLKLVDYDNLDTASAYTNVGLNKSRAAMKSVDADGWEDEITLSDEKTLDTGSDEGSKYRIATVNIYQKGDTTPRYSLQVPVLSTNAGSSDGDNDVEFFDQRLLKALGLEYKDGIAPIPPGYKLENCVYVVNTGGFGSYGVQGLDLFVKRGDNYLGDSNYGYFTFYVMASKNWHYDGSLPIPKDFHGTAHVYVSTGSATSDTFLVTITSVTSNIPFTTFTYKTFRGETGKKQVFTGVPGPSMRSETVNIDF